jgi:hypothetical protein
VAALPCWTPWPLIEICARSLFTELQAGPSTGHDLGRRERERVAGKTLWVGIDVGKTSHHACVVDADGKTVFSRKVKNRQGAIEELITRARTRAAQGSGSGDVVWALDMNSGSAALLVTLLAATGQRLLSVPGRLVNRMAGAFAGEGKTDAKDARTIAQTARLRGDLTEITLPDRIVGDLQVLTARRADLMADWVRGVNRLRELLGAIFPGLEEAHRARTDHHRHRAAHPPGSASVTIASTPCSKPCSVRLLLATGFQQPRSARPGRRATRHTQRNQRQPSRLRPTPAPRPQAHHPHPRKPTATDSATSVASTPCCSPTSTASCYAPGLANSSTPARQRPADSAPQPRTTNGPRRPHPASRTRITKTRLDLADFADPSFASATPAPDRRRGPVGPATARILQR